MSNDQMQHLIDTVPKLGMCARCGAYVLTCLVAGSWTGVDTVPLSLDALRARLVARQRVYRLSVGAAGDAQTLRPARLADVERGTELLGEHECAGHPMDARSVQEPPQDPPCPPVSPTGRPARPCVSSAPRGTHSSRASAATPHRSRRCDTCRQPIAADAPYWAIECGTYIWARHDECPKDER